MVNICDYVRSEKKKERNYFFLQLTLSDKFVFIKIRNTHDVGFGLFRCLWGS